jgi:lipopolysaccharide transport system permease protein
VATWLSALTIRYRDFHHVIPYLINYGIWLTPVFFPATIIPAGYQWLLYLNPMAAVLAWFRWSLFGAPAPSSEYWICIVPMFGLLLSGLLYFRKIETKISDYV